MTIIADSSFIYALYNAGDNSHREALIFASRYASITIVPDVVLPEVCYLFRRDFGYRGVQSFLGRFTLINWKLEALELQDLTRIYEISTQYASARFDLVDCCIMAIAERLNITRVATFDWRDFSIFRPRHCEFLELLPSM